MNNIENGKFWNIEFDHWEGHARYNDAVKRMLISRINPTDPDIMVAAKVKALASALRGWSPSEI